MTTSHVDKKTSSPCSIWEKHKKNLSPQIMTGIEKSFFKNTRTGQAVLWCNACMCRARIQEVETLIDWFYVIEWSYRAVFGLHSKKSISSLRRDWDVKLLSLVNRHSKKLSCHFWPLHPIKYQPNMKLFDKAISAKIKEFVSKVCMVIFVKSYLWD